MSAVTVLLNTRREGRAGGEETESQENLEQNPFTSTETLAGLYLGCRYTQQFAGQTMHTCD